MCLHRRRIVICVNTLSLKTRASKEALLQMSFKAFPLLSPPQVLSTALCVFSLCPRSKQVKCLKRCIEVSLRILYDGYVIWHNASERPSQIKWQMLFFASWIFLGQADFETLLFAILLSLSLSLCGSCTLSSAYVFFSSTMTLEKPAILVLFFCCFFFKLNFKHNYGVIAKQKERGHWCLTCFFNWHSAICFVQRWCLPCPSRSLFCNIISCVYRREASVSIDTDINIPVFGLFMTTQYKDKRRGCTQWNAQQALDFLLVFQSLKTPLVPEGNEAFWELQCALPVNHHLSVFAAVLQSTITHFSRSSTTRALTSCLWPRLPIRLSGWMALIGKICGIVVSLTCEWQ